MQAASFLSLIIVFSSINLHSSNALRRYYYHKTCPKAESTITNAVKEGMSKDDRVPAALLRMHFHDCFIRGCDASVLLNSYSNGNNESEKEGPPNVSLHAFYVINSAKKEVEKICPGVVSCADILAMAARDAVALTGGPSWDVPNGRKDSRISNAIDTLELPFPTFNISQLHQSFFQRGLSSRDMVALSGGHTLGFSHCSSFQNRIHNFDEKTIVDPSLDRSFAHSLREVCPMHNKVHAAGAYFDSTPTVFDNSYFKLLLQGKSILTSDQALLASPKTKAFVTLFAKSQEEFFNAFVRSMIKMSRISGNGSEIRLNCTVPN